MLPISVCIIAKNEEAHIEECCKHIVPYGFEIVLADTGSTDRTVELAEKYTDKIYHFDWCNDFSAAKNFAMDKASHDWILSLDCDEYIEYIDEKVLELCMAKQTEKAAGRILLRNRFTADGQTVFEQVRLSRFVNRNNYRFTGAVHEQLEPIDTTVSKSLSNSALVKTVYDAPITVLHVGYDLSEAKMRDKCLRNISLLEAELNKQGADPYLYYQLGQSYRRLKDYENACHYFDLGLSMDIDPGLDYVKTMVESYGYTLLDLKRNQDALRLLNIYDIFAVRADFVFLIGLIYMNNGLFEQSIKEFQKATTMSEFSVDGVNSYKANYNIGVIYECSGNLKTAKEYYKKCGNYAPAKNRLSAI